MKLTYHEGKNFGDALNPMVFHHFLGEKYFDEDTSVRFLGIGSILGLKKQEGKKIVFSSGYAAGDDNAYGTVPVIDEHYQIVCVRGPKTAKALNIAPELAIADGAILMPLVYMPIEQTKRFKCSLILHHKSLDFYTDWVKLCDEIGIHLIDVRKDVKEVVGEIVASEMVICEAMHGAIVADAYRVPWVPANFYPHINTFKWQDWCASLEMIYAPENCTAYLHDLQFMATVVQRKTFLPRFLSKLIASYYLKKRKKLVKKFILKKSKEVGSLSESNMLKLKQEMLLNAFNKLKRP